jgi:hypothetical protein
MAVVYATAPYDAELDAQWQEWFDGSVVPEGNEPEGQADPAASADLVVATFDDQSGHPVNVFVDAIANGVDDEVTYVGRDLRPIR